MNKKLKTLVILLFFIGFGIFLISCTKKVPKHYITFETNGGTPIERISYDDGNLPYLPNFTTKEGYDFDGWYFDAALTLKFENIKNGNDDFTLYAKWNPWTLRITTHSNTVPNQEDTYFISYEDVDKHLHPNTFDKENYNFIYWSTSVNASGTHYQEGADVSALITGNNTIYLWAIWEGELSSILYENNGGFGPIGMYGHYNDDIEAPLDPTLDGYTFEGWYEDPDFEGDAFVFDKMPLGETILWAKYSATVYTIILDLYGTGYTKQISYTIEDTFNLPLQTRYGFSFEDWTITVADGSWIIDLTLESEETIMNAWGNVTLRANWIPNPYHIYYYDGVELIEDFPYDVTTRITLPKYEKTGYLHTGWATTIYNGSNGNWTEGWINHPGDRYSSMWGDVILTIVWELVTYHLTINTGTYPESISVPYTIEDAFELPSYSRYGRTLDDFTVIVEAGTWLIDVTYTPYQAIEVGAWGNATLEMNWTLNEYHLNYYDGEELLQSVSYDVTDHLTILNFEKPGYHVGIYDVSTNNEYSNWANGSTLHAFDNLSSMWGDASLIINWTLTTYHLTLETGTYPATISVEYTIEEAFELPSYSRYGRTLDALIVIVEGGTWLIDSIYAPNQAIEIGAWGDATLEMNWSLIEYHIYYYDESDLVQTVTYYINDYLDIENFEKDGYILLYFTVETMEDYTNWVNESILHPFDSLSSMWGDVILHLYYEAV